MATSKAFPLPNYTQTPNNFFEMLPEMKEAEIRVTLIMIRKTFGFHRNNFKMSVKELEEATGMSRQGVLNGAEAAEKRGTFRRTNPDNKEKAEWELVISEETDLHQVEVNLNEVEVEPLPSRGQVGVKESIKETIKQKGGIEWGILFESQISDLDIQANLLKEKALTEFERIFGFGTLPWSSNSVWTKFEKFVVKIYSADQNVFTDYTSWREGEGKYKAYSNRKIRQNPQEFIDTGFPEFEASKMYWKREPVRPEHVRFTGDEDESKFIANPFKKPDILRRPTSLDSD